MSFNPDINNQATEVYFSERREKSLITPIIFSNIILTFPCQKRLGLVLDSKLSFNEHVNQKINKCNRIIGLLKRLSRILQRDQLLTICKTFVRSHADYADIIYDNLLMTPSKRNWKKCSIYYYWSNKKYFSGTFVPRTWP